MLDSKSLLKKNLKTEVDVFKVLLIFNNMFVLINLISSFEKIKCIHILSHKIKLLIDFNCLSYFA